jgi:predicted small metal-binding protein
VAMTITCEAMGYSCGFGVSGESMDQIISGVRHHSLEFHDYSEDEVNDPQVIESWKGAIRQSARPGDTRTPRDESDRDVKPH